MSADDFRAAAYPFDRSWAPEPDWKPSSDWHTDRSWAPDKGWSRFTEPPRRRQDNGGASFVAWEPKPERVPEADRPAPGLFKRPAKLEPGLHIVQRSMSFEQLLAHLFPEKAHSYLISRLKALNPTHAQGFKAGEIFVIGDLLNPTACLREEAELMAAAAQVRTALEPLSEEEADFMVRHQAEIANILGGAGTSLGLTKDVLDKGLRQIGETLRDIEYLHQTEFATHGHLRSHNFFVSRHQLLTHLDSQLKATFMNKQLNLGHHPLLHRDLGISTRSLVHHWSRSGAPGQIPGYATHIEEVAKAARYLKYGGYIGIGLGGTASALKVQEVCRGGETEACKKARFTETASFFGGIGLGGLGTAATTASAPYLCGAIGFASAGAGGFVCSLVLIGIGSYISGKGGEWGGEMAGEEIYRVLQ
ncbi:hypothetical protein [Pseudomonas sp. PI1]|uniref:hypothetical protein n=1 Tax=Pseudomonas sp. PI1 TaxID=1582493 RepID=UPI0005B7FA8E|nr:hypothetical protein [Pseudomonas sp. PI1]KWR76441.1 hypothetical protein RN02_20420 [Pseudomonas sp. PI1]